MELKILVDDLKHMQDISFYNNNYYELPISINGCDILFGESDDDHTTLWELGKFVNGRFERNCYLGESDTMEHGVEIINLLDANVNHIWT